MAKASRGDADKPEINFDGFYLTRGHHSNNSSAMIHDSKIVKIIASTHPTKRAKSSNLERTSSGAEGDMMKKMLQDLLNKKFQIKTSILDKDAACQEILLTLSPETEIVYCCNHMTKTFHGNLLKSRRLPPR